MKWISLCIIISEVNTQMCAIMHFFVTHIRNNYNTTKKKYEVHHGICSSSFICVNLLCATWMTWHDKKTNFAHFFDVYACTYTHYKWNYDEESVLMCGMIIIKYISPHLYMHVRIYLCMEKVERLLTHTLSFKNIFFLFFILFWSVESFCSLLIRETTFAIFLQLIFFLIHKNEFFSSLCFSSRNS